MKPAGKYPVQALFFVLQHAELLQFILKLFVTEAVLPVYWIFSSLVLKHRQSLFSQTLKVRGIDSAKVTKWGPRQRSQIEGLVRLHEARKASRMQQKEDLSNQHPAAAKLIWLFTPPKPNAGRGEYMIKRLASAPFRAVLPFLFVLFGAANSATTALDAMQPYFIMKGPLSEAEMEAIVDKHRWQFRAFGGAALVLNCIPVLSLLLGFCNTVAAALWAADLELANIDLSALDPAPSSTPLKQQ